MVVDLTEEDIYNIDRWYGICKRESYDNAGDLDTLRKLGLPYSDTPQDPHS